MADFKPQFASDFNEFETRDAGHEKAIRTTRMAESARLGLTVLALVASITIVGTAADALSVYNTTTLGSEYFLSLWPSDFDIRPTTALIICGAIVIVASTCSLAASKIPALRNKALVHSTVSFLAPTVCLIAGLIGTSFFYGVNASDTNFSLQSWSCQWSPISMDTKPHWGRLCKEHKAALYLTVMLIPLELLIAATAAFGAVTEKKRLIIHERKGSPAMS